MRIKTLLLCIAGLAFAYPALAETNLVMSCQDTTNTPAGTRLDVAGTAKCPVLSWVRPAPNTLVASCTTANCGAWAGADSQWRAFGTLPDTARVAHCTKDVPYMTSWGLPKTLNVDPCALTDKPTPWLLKTQVIVKPTVPGEINVSWLGSTENTDGTPLTDLAGYNLYKGSQADLSGTPEKIQKLGGLNTTHRFTALATGTYYLAATAYTTASPPVESDKSTIVRFDVVYPLPTISFSANPPSGTGTVASTLSWGVATATSCTGSDGWSGTKDPAAGSQGVSVTVTTKYTLTCTGPGGSATASTTVAVTTLKKPKSPAGFKAQ